MNTKSKWFLAVITLVSLLLVVALAPALSVNEPILTPQVYIPVAMSGFDSSVPTATLTAIPVPPTPTATPGPTQTLWMDNQTGGRVCFELVGSGIPARCTDQQGVQLWGTFTLTQGLEYWLTACDIYMSGNNWTLGSGDALLVVRCGYLSLLWPYNPPATPTPTL